MLSLPKQIPVQSLLSNATSNHVLDTQKENFRKLYKTLFSKRMQTKKKHNEQCIKNKHLSDYIYSIANS